MEVGDSLLAVALGLGRDAAPTNEDEIGDVVRSVARLSRFARSHAQVDDFMPGGLITGLKVERLGAVEAASKCDERDFHLVR